MGEFRIKFSGIHGIVALAVLAIFLVLRFASLGETDDPELRATIHAELLNELGGRIGQELPQLDQQDGAAVAAFVARAEAERIEVHSARVSKPIFSFGSSTKAVVRVEYSLPDGPRRTEYWRFEHSTIAGWRHRGSTFVLVYYLNFI